MNVQSTPNSVWDREYTVPSSVMTVPNPYLGLVITLILVRPLLSS